MIGPQPAPRAGKKMSPSALGRLSSRLTTRWQSWLATGASAVSSALEHAPENAAYGLLVFASLGPAFGPTAMALALLGTVVANVIASTLGGGRVVSGTRAAQSLLTAGFVTALSGMLTAAGQPSPGLVLALCALGVACAGLLQTGFGLLKLGSIVKYTPYPVRAGVTSGVGLLLVITALPVMTGHSFGTGLSATFEDPQFGPTVVGLCALVVTWLTALWFKRLPSVLMGLAAATLLHFVLGRWPYIVAPGALTGEPALPAGGFIALDPRLLLHADVFTAPLLALIGTYAVTIAVLGSLDTLIVTSVVDGRLRRTREANRELCAQGLANVATGLVAGQPLVASIPRTLALVIRSPEQRHIVTVYALVMLALLLCAPQLVGQVPRSAIGGVLLLQGISMLAPVFWHVPLELWRQGQSAADADQESVAPRVRRADWVIELAVALSAVILGLGPAVVIGATCAVLLFVRANMRDVVRNEWTGQTRRSLKTRPPALAEALAKEGNRIALLELQGSLFFGTADGLRARLERLETAVETAILDLHQVTEVDVTAARILFETAEHWHRAGRTLVFSEWPAGDARRALIEVAGPLSARQALTFTDHTDQALEQAEERLLSRIMPMRWTGRVLSLADTQLGRELTADEIALLAPVLIRQRFLRGDILFRVGDPGDGLYVSLLGDIGLRIPGSARRLASFAPGTVIGEMATLARGTRSVEAIAESEVIALKLSLDAFDRLLVEHPALAAKLLKNLSLHLADRVRVLTSDLSHWVARAAAGHTSPPIEPRL